MKIIVFGLGKYYKNRKETLLSYPQADIIAYTDNNEHLWGGDVDGVPIVSPQDAAGINCDVILIMSSYKKEIYKQMTDIGVKESRMILWEFFCSKMISGTRSVLHGKDIGINHKGNVLVISTNLDYTGGPLSAIYSALALKERGYNAVLATACCDSKLAHEVTEKGITIYVCPTLPYMFDDEKEWIRQFDFVIVNTLAMMYSAYECGCLKPTLWWIHEVKEFYDFFLTSPWNMAEGSKLDNLTIYSVSDIAKMNFNKLFAEKIIRKLCYGIPDHEGKLICKDKGIKVNFAIIGNICKRKAQDIFVEAVSQMNCKEQAEFWIIGSYSNDEFDRKIQEMVKVIPSIKMLGVLTREELCNIFPQIDVVVCASREETMSITITEGMMFGKVCITTENTGIAEYMLDGENGFIVPVEDAATLRDRMEWLITHREEMERLGKAARKIYEQYFTMQLFGDSLEQALTETQNRWNLRGVTEKIV